jgi:hypothetical protein
VKPALLRRAAAAAAVAALLCAAPAWSGAPEITEALVARRAPAVVLVRLMLRVEMTVAGKSSDQEQAIEMFGTVADPTGLVLVGMDSHVARAAAKRAGATLRFVPKNIRVVFGDALDKEYDAALVARDEVLGLAYVQVLDLEGRKPVAVDFSTGSDPALGARVFGVWREGSLHDHVPMVVRAEIAQRIEQPRLLFGFTGEASQSGLVLYDAAGEPVGVVALQYASEDDLMDATARATSLRRFVLPLPAVRRSLAEAVAAARAAASAK